MYGKRRFTSGWVIYIAKIIEKAEEVRRNSCTIVRKDRLGQDGCAVAYALVANDRRLAAARSISSSTRDSGLSAFFFRPITLFTHTNVVRWYEP
jgi:hypothetical protein